MQNKVFALIAVIVTCSMTVNITIIMMTKSATIFPVYVMTVMATLFYLLQVTFPCLLPLYIASSAGRFTKFPTKKAVIFLIPVFVIFVLLLLSTFTKSIFYVNADNSFSHGPYFSIIYIVSFYYFIYAVVNAFRFRKELGRQQFFVIISSIAIIVTGFLLQKAVTGYYIAGAFVVFALGNIYFSVQKPYNMVEDNTGVLNYSALQKMIRGYLDAGKDFEIISVDLIGIRQNASLYSAETMKDLTRGVARFLSSISRKGNVFYVSKFSFAIVTTDLDLHNTFINSIAERFSNP